MKLLASLPDHPMRTRGAVEMAGRWKAWKSKSRIPTLPTAPWKSRKTGEIPTFPQLRRRGGWKSGKPKTGFPLSHRPESRSLKPKNKTRLWASPAFRVPTYQRQDPRKETSGSNQTLRLAPYWNRRAVSGSSPTGINSRFQAHSRIWKMLRMHVTIAFTEAVVLRKIPLAESLKIIGRGSLNWLAERPSWSRSRSPTPAPAGASTATTAARATNPATCRPAEYRRYMEALRPCVVQVSGGEPLMRDDVAEIVRADQGRREAAVYHPGFQLVADDRRERYLELREAGIDQFSVSLDFPDERHDEFPRLSRPLPPLEDLIPRLARLGHDDIVLNTCITSENVGEIGAIADKARDWGVNLCYSAYSARRTGCRDYFLDTPEQLAELNAELDRGGGAPRRHQLDRQRAHHARCHPPLFRERRRARLQGRPALPGGDRGWRAAALLHAVPPLPVGRRARA